MRWSIQASDVPIALKPQLAVQFDVAKKAAVSMSHDSMSIGLVELLINNHLDFLIGLGSNQIVQIYVNGHTWKSGTSGIITGSTQLELRIR